MDVQHDDDDLARIESDPDYRGGLDNSIVRAFRRVMNLVRNVRNETELYRWKGLGDVPFGVETLRGLTWLRVT